MKELRTCIGQEPPFLSAGEISFLRQIGENTVSLEELKKTHREEELKELLLSLAGKRALVVREGRCVKGCLSSEQIFAAEQLLKSGLAPNEENPFGKEKISPEENKDPVPLSVCLIKGWFPPPKVKKLSEADAEEILREHIEAHRNELLISALECATMIPDYLKKVVYDLWCRKKPELPRCFGLRALHFEAIESFLSQHSFSVKTEWEEGMKRELDLIREARLLPDLFYLPLEEAVRKLREEMSLTDIQEIQSILLDQEE